MSPRRRRFLVGLTLTLFLAACTSGAGDDSTTRCEQLRDHRVDLQLKTLTSRAGDDAQQLELIAKHRANLVSALGDEHVATCMATRSEAYLDCAMATTTKTQLAECDQ